MAMRTRDGLELGIGYGLILLVCWTARPEQSWLFWVAAAWIILATAGRLIGRGRGASFFGRPVLKQMGLDLLDSLRILWVLAAAVALSALALEISSRLGALHPIYGPQPPWRHAWGYIVWAIAQEFILLDFVLVRVRRLTSTPGRAIAITALLFAGVHIPNPLLVPLTVVWGWIACWLFLRYRGLFTLGVTHGLLGLVIAIGVPNSIHHHMRVGLGYLEYHQRTSAVRPIHLRNSDQRVSTVACVITDAPTLR